MVVSGEQKLGVGKDTWCHLSALKMEGVTDSNMVKFLDTSPTEKWWSVCPLCLVLAGLSVVTCRTQWKETNSFCFWNLVATGRKHRERHWVLEVDLPVPAEPFQWHYGKEARGVPTESWPNCLMQAKLFYWDDLLCSSKDTNVICLKTWWYIWIIYCAERWFSYFPSSLGNTGIPKDSSAA